MRCGLGLRTAHGNLRSLAVNIRVLSNEENSRRIGSVRFVIQIPFIEGPTIQFVEGQSVEHIEEIIGLQIVVLVFDIVVFTFQPYPCITIGEDDIAADIARLQVGYFVISPVVDITG